MNRNSKTVVDSMSKKCVKFLQRLDKLSIFKVILVKWGGGNAMVFIINGFRSRKNLPLKISLGWEIKKSIGKILKYQNLNKDLRCIHYI